MSQLADARKKRGGGGFRGGNRFDRKCGGDEAIDYFNKTLYTTTLEDCGEEFACGRDGEGRFVYRTRFQPATGMEYAWVTCTNVDKAWTRDVCGCNDMDCPDPET
ncbi:MAG: hypothetical protein SGARI_005693, partial [Bacillariaceae sp.]